MASICGSARQLFLGSSGALYNFMRMPNRFSNTPLSKQVAESLLKVLSGKEVEEIMGEHTEFSVDENWRPYGWRPHGQIEKNWDRIGVQTSEPVGALAELIINSIDAILMRKAKETGIDPSEDSAPSDMETAVKQFFPEVVEGRLINLSQAQRTALAEKSVLIGVKRHGRKNNKYPSYTIIDFGEGQSPAAFEGTFLSLGEKNKEGIPFVQGRFNMGSTGSITFCTRADIRNGLYKFILSKKNTEDSKELWGWTLIRVRKVRKGEELPVVEYFCPGGEISSFESDEIRAFQREDIGVLRKGGSVVKLYEYDIGPHNRDVSLGLNNSLTTSLIDCALPIRLYDFDAAPTEAKGSLRAKGIDARTFSGMKTMLRSDEEEATEGIKSEVKGLIENSENPSLGTISIAYFGIDKMSAYLRKYSYRMFYTINGQTQAKERASKLREAQLDDLRNHLIVQVDCNQMDNTARSAIFKPDRERMTQNDLTRELKQIVIDALKDEGALREYARIIRSRRISEQIENEENKEFLASLVKNNPDIQELFDTGNVVTDLKQTQGGAEEFEGKQFPTYLRPTNLEEGNTKSIPINTYRWIECETDVQDDYLVREDNQGKFLRPSAEELPHSRGSLRNGKFRIKVKPPDGAKEGDEIPVRFGFDDSNPDTGPLTFDATIKITAEEKIENKPSGGTTKTKKDLQPSKNFPDMVWVEEEGWDDHEFDEEAGGYVSAGEALTIYVNKGNKYLSALIHKESDESKREIIYHRFRYGVGILTLAMYKKLVHDKDEESNNDREESYDGDEALRLASSAVAAHVVTLIDSLGGNK